MAIAVEGMVAEQEQVVTSFILSIIFFALNMISCAYIVITVGQATVLSVFLVIYAYFWYAYTLRIYNRFKFTRDNNDMFFEGHHDIQEVQLNDAIDDHDGVDRKGRHIYNRLHSSSTDAAGPSSSRDYEQTKASLKSNTSKSYQYSDYVSLKEGSESLFFDPWKRRYAAIVCESLYIYEDKKMFEESPNQFIRGKKIDLLDVKIVLDGKDHPFQINISSNIGGKTIQFRCDTAVQLSQWIKVFNAISSQNMSPGGGGTS